VHQNIYTQDAHTNTGTDQDTIIEQSTSHCSSDKEYLGERINATGHDAGIRPGEYSHQHHSVKDLKDVDRQHNITCKSRRDESHTLVEETDKLSDKNFIPAQVKRQRKSVEVCKNENQSGDTIDWEEDDNPWLGCVCSKIHEIPTPVFWIQCDNCEAWYSCSPDCIGFDKNEAEMKLKWECPACTSFTSNAQIFKTDRIGFDATNSKYCTVGLISETESEHRSLSTEKTNQDAHKNYEHSVVKKKKEKEIDITLEIEQGSKPLPLGTIVNILSRTWVGSNKPGGVASILAWRSLENKIVYDVKYILGGREFSIKSKYVSVNEKMTNFSSPSGSTRRSRKILI